MDRPDATTGAAASESRAVPSHQVPPAPDPPGVRRALLPYLIVAALGLLAALIVLAQLWTYRDELRTILTQSPV